MSGESESEHDLLEQAYDYKVNGRYPEGCTLNKKTYPELPHTLEDIHKKIPN